MGESWGSRYVNLSVLDFAELNQYRIRKDLNYIEKSQNNYFSGALVNAVFLVALCFSITMESLKRFYEPEDIHDPTLILIVGALGLVVNVLGK